MSSHPIYITQHPKPSPQQESLNLYIAGLQKKISSAKWKQSLILKYNYIPLETAKQKIEEETHRYVRKLEILEEKLEHETQNGTIEKQVGDFRVFLAKLMGKIKEIQNGMESLNMEMLVLRAQVEEKRNSLKELMRENVNLNKFIIAETGKVKSGRCQPQPYIRVSLHQKTRPPTHLHTDRSSRTASTTTPRNHNPNHNSNHQQHYTAAQDLYPQCVDSIIKSLRTMNASEDVQAGIYLEIMQRKMQIKAPTYSLKSKACDVLMDRYRDLKGKKSRGNEDFCMSLGTFMGLNWKQIMGIVLVKDRNATKLRQLLQICQE